MKNWRIPAAGAVVGLVLAIATPAFASGSSDFSSNLCAAHAEFTGAFAKTSKNSGACLKLGVRAYLQNVHGGSPYWSLLKESASGANSVTRNADSSTSVLGSAHYARDGALAQGLPD